MKKLNKLIQTLKKMSNISKNTKTSKKKVSKVVSKKINIGKNKIIRKNKTISTKNSIHKNKVVHKDNTVQREKIIQEKSEIPMKIYYDLFESYGPQGWWPLLECEGVNPTKSGCINGYHPHNYSYPRDEFEQFEICIGAILTQNTSWPNVEKALVNLKKMNAINPSAILSLNDDVLKNAIRPAGYFNQKAKKLKVFSKFFMDLEKREPKRAELLDVWGVGPETADSILLYVYKNPVFVVDAYTKRIFQNIGLIKKDATYDEIKRFFEKNVKWDYKIYQEYHALIVEHAKRYYNKASEYKKCPLYKKYEK
ncbi:MAG: endonuclease III domain-containing protein [Candidatus Woesearchaeota archaeon]|jgi:endonuclease-3 related protein